MILFLENDVIFIGNDVSDWSISFVTSYLIGQSFCVSIGQLFMKWSVVCVAQSFIFCVVYKFVWCVLPNLLFSV